MKKFIVSTLVVVFALLAIMPTDVLAAGEETAGHTNIRLCPQLRGT
jgi:hypothetical protein